MKEEDKTSKEVIRKLVPDCPPIIIENVTDKDEPTLERHLIEEDLVQLSLDATKDVLL